MLEKTPSPMIGEAGAAAAAPRTQLERSALSDAKMAEAAVTLICERGTAATTLKDVGVQAGYSRGLAGYRFGTKTGLWMFLFRTIGEEWLGELRFAAEGTAGLATIHAALDAHCRFLLDSSDRIRAFYILWFDSVAGPDEELRALVAAVHGRRRRDVERWIASGVADGSIRADADVTGIAEQFSVAVVGIVYQWLVSPLAHAEVRRLHAGLKHQMSLSLSPEPLPTHP